MSKTVAIICEYNPFHNGHKHQIDTIKTLVPDANIICIMSGNVTQRGSFAMFDKYSRAKSALLCGANAVFELPYPYCASNAEIFALQGVNMASQLGADYLCFGIEGEIDVLVDIAELIDTNEFEAQMDKYLKNKSISYISAKEKALSSLGRKLPTTSNDMLAIEYLRAIKKLDSSLIPLPIRREGAGYNDLSRGHIMSASAIRHAFYNGDGILSVPKEAQSVYNEEISNELYLDVERAEQLLYLITLKSTPEEIEALYDAPSGCGFFIYEKARSSNGASDFFDALTSKTYTYARLRRIVMYLVFNTRQIEKELAFAVLLGADKKGCSYIKAIKKNGIKIVTKHSDTKSLSKADLEIYNTMKRVDEIYYSMLKSPQKPADAYKKNAIIL